MSAMPAVRTASELYPIERNPETWRFLRMVLTGATDPRGNAVLRRDLTMIERQMLSSRAKHLAPHLEPGRPVPVAKAVAEMLSGFGSARASEDGAEVTVTQYATALRGIPLWVVQRACGRFARGEVTAEELGEKTISRAFPPATPHLRMVCDDMVKTHWLESYQIAGALRGTVGEKREEVTDEERKAAGARMAEYVERRKKAEADEERRKKAEADEERLRHDSAAIAADAARRASQTAILNEYVEAGLDPVWAGDGVTLVSLSLLLSQGWKVRSVEGKQILTKPAQVQP